MIASIEFFMYRVSDLLLAPVILGILFVFFYGIFCLGQVTMKKYQRRASSTYNRAKESNASGFELHQFLRMNPQSPFEQIEVHAFKQIELTKLVTKVSPMLGLIATMIPMGPALKSLADGNIQGISENLSIAFAAVIFALAAASMTFICLSIQKKWLAQDLADIHALLESNETTNSVENRQAS